MKELHRLTDLQLALLDVLWEKGEATATQVHEAVEADTGLARKTVGTLLTRLERQGVVTHRAEGREFVWRAAVEREEVRTSVIRNLLEGLFEHDPASLVSHVLREEEVEPGDAHRIRELIERWHEEREE